MCWTGEGGGGGANPGGAGGGFSERPECRTGRQGSAVSASCGWKWGEALWWREERAAVQGEAVSDRVRGGEKSITIG